MRPLPFKSSPFGRASLVCALLNALAFAAVFVVYLFPKFFLENLSFGTVYLVALLGFFGFVVFVFVCSLVGVLLAFGSLYYREERRVLAVLSLIMNLGPLIVVVLLRTLP